MVFGARAKLTLYVIDTKGNPVPDANVLGWFWQGGGEHNKRVDVHTDEKGFCVLEGKTMSHIRFYVSKEGFYDTDWEFYFVARNNDCVERGRWIPWNPTLEVVLKEKRNPMDLPTRKNFPNWTTIPSCTEIGFDIEKNAFLPPDGEGEIADFYLQFDVGSDMDPIHPELS